MGITQEAGTQTGKACDATLNRVIFAGNDCYLITMQGIHRQFEAVKE